MKVLFGLLLAVGGALAQAPAPSSVPTLSCAEIETFLKTAKVGAQRTLPVGVTVPSRALLDDGRLKHEAVIQTVDVAKLSHPTPTGTELNFRDAWQFNVAGYELAKMLKLNMVPPYVERTVAGVSASVTWMVPDVVMERDRVLKKISPPEMETWNAQVLASRLFHELIADTDVNMTNLLITKDWRLWLIDFTRAFRLTKKLQEPERLTAVDRTLLAAVRSLTRADMEARLRRWIDRPRIDAVLARRDLLVRLIDERIAAQGEAAVLYDFPRTSEACGTGLQ